MSWVSDVVEAAPPDRQALVELRADGTRREWCFDEVVRAAGRVAVRLQEAGATRGDVVLTLVGNRPEWVAALVACFREGFVAFPCNEQLRAADLRGRIDAVAPRVVVCDPRNDQVLDEAGWTGPRVWIPFEEAAQGPRPTTPAPQLDGSDPCLLTFTSGTSGRAKGVLHGQRYLHGQRLQATSWLGGGEGDLVWCTAASGWSKSARNAFIAPWMTGSAALLHDGRFDPEERLDILEREAVAVLCMAPTEYRIIAKRGRLRRFPQLRTLVAAGEALNADVLERWRAATGIEIRDGYGQTETGQLTANPVNTAARPGSMGLPLPGVDLRVEDGELVVDPATVPTFFLGYLADPDQSPPTLWRTGDRVSQDADGYLYFEGRADDVIISSGYRIGPFEVESALIAHPAVTEAAAVAAPDEERGSVVRAVVVLADGFEPTTELAAELQAHVKAITAPYKYPRIVDFVAELPKTASGKVIRSALR